MGQSHVHLVIRAGIVRHVLEDMGGACEEAAMGEYLQAQLFGQDLR